MYPRWVTNRQTRTGGAGLLYNAWIGIKPASFEPLAPTRRAVRYVEGRRRGVRPLVDIYVPDTLAPPGGYPSVMLIHGGAFLVGSRRMKAVRYLARELCSAGFVVGCPDYRLIFRGGRLAEQLADVSTARGFWDDLAEELQLNPSRVSGVGVSAGAALLLLQAADPQTPAYDRLAFIYGLYDFAGLGGPAGLVKRWLTRSRDPQTWVAQSPLEHAEAVKEPLLVVHGERDTLVRPEQAHRLVERRRAAGLPTEFEEFEGMRHGWLNEAKLPESQQLARRLVDFLGGGPT